MSTERVTAFKGPRQVLETTLQSRVQVGSSLSDSKETWKYTWVGDFTQED